SCITTHSGISGYVFTMLGTYHPAYQSWGMRSVDIRSTTTSTATMSATRHHVRSETANQMDAPMIAMLYDGDSARWLNSTQKTSTDASTRSRALLVAHASRRSASGATSSRPPASCTGQSGQRTPHHKFISPLMPA